MLGEFAPRSLAFVTHQAVGSQIQMASLLSKPPWRFADSSLPVLVRDCISNFAHCFGVACIKHTFPLLFHYSVFSPPCPRFTAFPAFPLVALNSQFSQMAAKRFLFLPLVVSNHADNFSLTLSWLEIWWTTQRRITTETGLAAVLVCISFSREHPTMWYDQASLPRGWIKFCLWW